MTASGHNRKFIKSRELYSRDKHTTLDVSDLSGSNHNSKEIRKERGRLASTRRTLMMQEDIKHKSGKFFDLAKELEVTRRELEISKKTLMLQESQIE